MNNHLVFFDTCDEDAEEWGLQSDAAHTLYVGIKRTDDLFWYDNYAGEWHKSLSKLKDVINDSNFKKVTKFDNGYITIDSAIQYFMSKPHIVGEDAFCGL